MFKWLTQRRSWAELSRPERRRIKALMLGAGAPPTVGKDGRIKIETITSTKEVDNGASH